MLILLYIWTHGVSAVILPCKGTVLPRDPQPPLRSAIRAGYRPTRELKGRARYPAGFA